MVFERGACHSSCSETVMKSSKWNSVVGWLVVLSFVGIVFYIALYKYLYCQIDLGNGVTLLSDSALLMKNKKNALQVETEQKERVAKVQLVNSWVNDVNVR